MTSPIANFLGIGAQKCATTWVYRVLQDHPQVAVSEPKELDFFSAAYDRGRQWYEGHFARGPAKAAGEISPSYFHDPLAPARAQAYNPDFRIVLMVRDPIARAYSNHLHEVRIGQYRGPDLSFEAGLANNPMYVEQSRYGRHFRNWLAHFPQEHILVLIQEEIESDPVTQARRLYEFLGLDVAHQSAFLFRRANPSSEEKLKGLNAALRRLGGLARRIGAHRIVNLIRRNPLVEGLRSANQRPLDQVIPAMSEATRQALLNLLREDTREFARLLKRSDLPWPTLRTSPTELRQIRTG
jgi:Sulfotransferase domain